MRLADHLPENAVQIWRIALDEAAWDKHTGILDAGEHARAQRLQDARRQTRFLRCRAALRVLLGRYAGTYGGDLKFDYGRFGKPELAAEDRPRDGHELSGDLHFNLSHCEKTAAVAVSRRPVGIDLEIPAERDVDALGRLVCHPSEMAALAGACGPGKLQLFYRLWTRKEAYWKAVGTGVRSDLRDVTFASTAASSRVEGSMRHTSVDYFVHDFSLPGGIPGCVSTTLSAPAIEIFVLHA